MVKFNGPGRSTSRGGRVTNPLVPRPRPGGNRAPTGPLQPGRRPRPGGPPRTGGGYQQLQPHTRAATRGGGFSGRLGKAPPGGLSSRLGKAPPGGLSSRLGKAPPGGLSSRLRKAPPRGR